MDDRAGTLKRMAVIILSHLALVVIWQLFVTLDKVPAFVMPTPGATLQTLTQPQYRWLENSAVTAAEIFGGYALAVVIGVTLAMLFSWWRGFETGRCRS